MMLTFGCTNEIYGSTRNPYNGDRTSGGSSSGEGALLALNGRDFLFFKNIHCPRIKLVFCACLEQNLRGQLVSEKKLTVMYIIHSVSFIQYENTVMCNILFVKIWIMNYLHETAF